MPQLAYSSSDEGEGQSGDNGNSNGDGTSEIREGQQASSIIETICNDGIDNDGDGLVDLDDIEDCPTTPTSTPPPVADTDDHATISPSTDTTSEGQVQEQQEQEQQKEVPGILQQPEAQLVLPPPLSTTPSEQVQQQKELQKEICNNGDDDDGDGKIDEQDIEDCPTTTTTVDTTTNTTTKEKVPIITNTTQQPQEIANNTQQVSVTRTSPEDGSTGVPVVPEDGSTVGTRIVAWFSGRIPANSIIWDIQDQTGTSVSGTHRYYSDHETHKSTFTTSSPLATSMKYKAWIVAQTTDVWPSKEWSFTTTSDVYSPVVIATLPQHDQIRVPHDFIITATFSEPIDPETVDESLTLVLDRNGNWVWGETSLSSDGKTVSFTPSRPLDPDSKYTAIIRGGTIRDLALNPLAANKIWQFTTLPYSEPVIVDERPSPSQTVPYIP